MNQLIFWCVSVLGCLLFAAACLALAFDHERMSQWCLVLSVGCLGASSEIRKV